MSELSPLSASRLGELALEAGIPAGVLNIVHGLGVETGEPLCSHPDVRAISFTGSTATGDRIVRAAGLKKLSMRSEEHTSELQSLMRISYAVFCCKTNKHKI